MRNRITARWKFIDRADPENTNNYLNRNLTSFSQLIGNHACSPLLYLPACLQRCCSWAKGVISKKWARWDSVLSFPQVLLEKTPGGITSPEKHLFLQPITILWTDIWSIHSHIHSFFSTPYRFKTYVLNMYCSGARMNIDWRQVQSLPLGEWLFKRKEDRSMDELMRYQWQCMRWSIGIWHQEDLGLNLSSDLYY